MELLPVTLFGAAALCTGFGRVSRRLCVLLAAMGARVAVAARKAADRAEAQSLGYRALDLKRLESEDLKGFDCVFNSVPALVLPRGVLERLCSGCVLIDLASAPGGVDFKSAAALGLSFRHAPGLPGTAAPKTAAEIILNTVLQMIDEREHAQ